METASTWRPTLGFTALRHCQRTILAHGSSNDEAFYSALSSLAVEDWSDRAIGLVVDGEEGCR
eukprot:6580945-Pyramimonas_sp.AAC.1